MSDLSTLLSFRQAKLDQLRSIESKISATSSPSYLRQTKLDLLRSNLPGLPVEALTIVWTTIGRLKQGYITPAPAPALAKEWKDISRIFECTVTSLRSVAAVREYFESIPTLASFSDAQGRLKERRDALVMRCLCLSEAGAAGEIDPIYWEVMRNFGHIRNKIAHQYDLVTACEVEFEPWDAKEHYQWLTQYLRELQPCLVRVLALIKDWMLDRVRYECANWANIAQELRIELEKEKVDLEEQLWDLDEDIRMQESFAVGILTDRVM